MLPWSSLLRNLLPPISFLKLLVMLGSSPSCFLYNFLSVAPAPEIERAILFDSTTEVDDIDPTLTPGLRYLLNAASGRPSTGFGRISDGNRADGQCGEGRCCAGEGLGASRDRVNRSSGGRLGAVKFEKARAAEAMTLKEAVRFDLKEVLRFVREELFSGWAWVVADLLLLQLLFLIENVWLFDVADVFRLVDVLVLRTKDWVGV